MLFSLGLKRYPPTAEIVGLAAGRPPVNEKALMFLLNNMGTYYTDFDPNDFPEVSFIPATTATGENILAKPGEVSPPGTTIIDCD